MAKPATIPFGKFKVLVGDGASPETFSNPCGFTERALKLGSSTTSDEIPDCDDPDLPAWEAKGIKSLNAQVTGQGVLARAAHVIWRNWYMSALERNIRVVFDVPLADGGGYYEGKAVLTDLEYSGNYGEKVKANVTLQSSDAWAWHDAVA